MYYMMEPDYVHNLSSIWNLWFFNIVPKVLYKSFDLYKEDKAVHILGTSFFPNDIIEGSVYNNDLYITVPYRDEFFWIFENVKVEDLKIMYTDMNTAGGMEGFSKYFDWPLI